MVDRLVVRDGIRVRLTDSVETALRWGENKLSILRKRRKHRTANRSDWEEQRYSTNYSADGSDFSLGELTPKHFSFNSHLGACPACHGLGTQLVLDPDLMISDQTRSIAEGAITPWRRGTKRMRAYYHKLQGALVKHFQIDEEAPFADLPEGFKNALYFGTNGTPIKMNFSGNSDKSAAGGKRSGRSRDWCRKCSDFTNRRKASSPVTGFARSWPGCHAKRAAARG